MLATRTRRVITMRDFEMQEATMPPPADLESLVPRMTLERPHHAYAILCGEGRPDRV